VGRLRLVADKRLELAALGAVGQPADDGVPETPPERAGELGGLVDAAGHLQDSVGTRSADRLVLGQSGREFVPADEPVGEDDGILDRLRRALSDAGCGRVRGVAYQDDAAVAPAGGAAPGSGRRFAEWRSRRRPRRPPRSARASRRNAAESPPSCRRARRTRLPARSWSRTSTSVRARCRPARSARPLPTTPSGARLPPALRRLPARPCSRRTGSAGRRSHDARPSSDRRRPPADRPAPRGHQRQLRRQRRRLAPQR
jgi:hypothetical protein